MQGFHPSTLRQYRRLWSDFLAFQVAAGLPVQVTVEILLSFLEYLYQNAVTTANMQNYLAALRSLNILYDLDTTPFGEQRLGLFVKAVKLQAPFTPKRVNLLDIHMLTNYAAVSLHAVSCCIQTLVSIGFIFPF